MINGAPIAANGRVAVEILADPPVTFLSGFGYGPTGALSIITNGSPAEDWNAGFSFHSSKLRCTDIQDNPIVSPVYYNQELVVLHSTKEVLVTSTAPIARYVHGWPVAANGAVCITAGVPVVNAFTNGFDTGFD